MNVWKAAILGKNDDGTTRRPMTVSQRRELESLCETGTTTKVVGPKAGLNGMASIMEALERRKFVEKVGGVWRATDLGRTTWQAIKRGGLSCMELDCESPALGTGTFCLAHQQGYDAERAPKRTRGANHARADRDDDGPGIEGAHARRDREG